MRITNRNDTLKQAQAALSAGHVAEAMHRCAALLRLDPEDVEARHGLGLCRMELGDLPGAAQAFRETLARNPRLADAHNNLGVIHDRLGQLPEAIDCFRRAVAIRPAFLRALLNLGSSLMRAGDASAAAAVYEDAAARAPHDALLHSDLGAARLAADDFAGAARALERAVLLDPRLGEAQANLGEALRNLNRPEEARAAFERALAIKPDLAEAHLGLGKIAAAADHAGEAVARLMRALELKPKDAHIALNVASLLEQLGFQDQALAALDAIARAVPANADFLERRAEHLHRLGQLEAALAGYEDALRVQADRAGSLLGRGRALESLGRHAEAIGSLERALALRAGHGETLAALASCAFRVCDWGRIDEAMGQLRQAPLGIDHLHPFLLLGAELPPLEQAQSLKRRGPRSEAPPPRAPIRYRQERLKVAYVSPDFREHPVAHALAGVIERQNRKRFTPIAVSLARPDSSDIGRRLRASFDEFIDVSSSNVADTANLLRQSEIDIAIDLAGHTSGARPAIFARRVAPLQVNYLGFPASSGSPFIDYLIADEIVVPSSSEAWYTERILRMPNCYLPFDCSRSYPRAALSRGEAGLPEDGFVFCAFNNGYKITRMMFDLWLGLLRDVPGSVLWLRSMGDLTVRNLKSAAAAAGIAAERLVVARYLDDADLHLARLRAADVFLDTLPYNAHTSAAEALWAGVPVITCRGHTFAGRVGASLLTAAGLPALISEDLAGYRSQALELAHSPAMLKSLREQLDESRRSAAVFDTERYTRDFEQLLLRMHAER